MPQMSPLSWEILFMYFLVMFLFMSTIIYWSNIKSLNKKSEMKKENKFMNWKW
uniref:ATP synthase complex subunit 8 n=1 Tax=Oxycarenus lugubris TaxID=2813423 RepID=A0A8T9ZY92_9HEMI|nr:ATPase subunit 8 [Oxycarenus lugubris]